jgi:transposase
MKPFDARKLSPQALESIRKLAVQAVLSGKKKLEVAALFGISRVTLWKWVKAYHANGDGGLKVKPHGRPRNN